MSNINMSIKSIKILTSPLGGEVCFQREREPASIRKQGEGNRNNCGLFTPHPIFRHSPCVLISKIDLSPKGRGGVVGGIFCAY